MKSASKKRAPTIVNLTVKRRYLTEREVERLMDCARKHGRYGHRDATMILVAYRHGLRASEVCDLQWQQIELSEGRLHVHRVKNGIPSVHPIRGDEMRGLRKLRREYPKEAYVSHRLPPPHPPGRRGCQDAFPDPPTHAALPVGLSSPTMATTHGLCSTTSGTRTSSTRSATPSFRPTGSRTFGEADLRPWASWCRRFRAPASSGRLPLPPQSPWHSRPPRAAPAFPGSTRCRALAAPSSP
jgi:hypothetical protein